MHREVLAVIPARGGSKGIPRKNLALLRGRPLIAHAVHAARGAASVTRTVVSTDDAEIAHVARHCGAETPFMRPAELAGDDAHSVHAVLHAVCWLRDHESYAPDAVVQLHPTSPLRRSDHIDEAVELFFDRAGGGVVAVSPLPTVLPHLRRIRRGVLEPVVPLDDPNVQFKDAEPLYYENGSIYVAAPGDLLAAGTFHLPGAVAYVMPPAVALDIDDPADLAHAEGALERAEAAVPLDDSGELTRVPVLSYS